MNNSINKQQFFLDNFVSKTVDLKSIVPCLGQIGKGRFTRENLNTKLRTGGSGFHEAKFIEWNFWQTGHN